jgi:hypothetical protein
MHWLRLMLDGLWVLTPMLESVLVVAMVRRRVFVRFPVFFAYVVADACFTAVMFVMDKLPSVSGPAWTRVYFPGLVILSALQFTVVWEVFDHIFRVHSFLNRFGKPLFRTALVAFFLAGITAAAFTRTHEAYPTMAILHLLQQTASILLVGLLGSLFIFSAFFGLSWRSFVFGIALGMGSDAAVNLAAAAIKEYFGLSGSIYLNLLTQGSSNLSVLIWVFYLFMPDTTGGNGNMKNLSQPDLEDWNQELREISRR